MKRTPETDLKMIETILTIAGEEVSLWGTGVIGIALMNHYVTGSFVTVTDLTKLTTLGEAQVRRRLDQLISQGLVYKQQNTTGPHLYMATHNSAEKYLNRIWGSICVAFCKAD